MLLATGDQLYNSVSRTGERCTRHSIIRLHSVLRLYFPNTHPRTADCCNSVRTWWCGVGCPSCVLLRVTPMILTFRECFTINFRCRNGRVTLCFTKWHQTEVGSKCWAGSSKLDFQKIHNLKWYDDSFNNFPLNYNASLGSAMNFYLQKRSIIAQSTICYGCLQTAANLTVVTESIWVNNSA